MKKEELIQILMRISSGEASDEDIHLYNNWCNSFQGESKSIDDFEQIKANMLMEIEKQTHYQTRTSQTRLLPRIGIAAASIIIILLVGSYIYLHSGKQSETPRMAIKDVAPGGNKAILTLGNGQTISLDSIHNGQLAALAGSNISKPQNGLLVYSAENNNSEAVQYNTLSTPRGGQYKLVLPDGTKVWLNAASSIKYPTTFKGTDRTVTITGEAYFEVIHNAQKPFRVTVKNQTIEDIGTEFDVNAYGDEAVIKTTLLQGSVRVMKGNSFVVLQPGQQAIVSDNSDDINIQEVNASNKAAWINGFVSMDKVGVKEFMNQLSRWYNVDIEYQGTIPNKKYGGLINRNTNLSDVLFALKASGINTRLEGNKIIVLPN